MESQILKPEVPPVGLLAVQPYFLTVGEPGGFATGADFYRYAASVGFTHITLPADPKFLDVGQLMESSAARDDFHARFAGYGLKVHRIETHCAGQRRVLDHSRIAKFACFAPEGLRGSVNRSEHELSAEAEMMELIELSALLGFHEIPSFPGGRAYARAQAKWPAYPKHFALWVTAMLVHKWQPLLEFAARHGQVVTFELGHPEEDLITAQNFLDFYNTLSPLARKGVGVNLDMSHWMMIGDDPRPHFEAVFAAGVYICFHFKGATVECTSPRHSRYGGFEDWSSSGGRFATVGLFDLGLWTWFAEFALRVHARQERGIVAVAEGECLYLTNPLQAMEIMRHNTTELIHGRAPRSFLNITQAEGVRPWSGGDFDTFAMNRNLTPAGLLDLDDEEIGPVRVIVERILAERHG